jgi:DNA-binding MarR family transcriptional regulator
VEAFVALLRAHSSLTRQLSAQLTVEHDLTLSDFEVLLRLSRAPDQRMRRVDLADQVLLSASGVTRLLDGLERQGYVERAACSSDRRVVYAVLTDSGLERLRSAAASHFGQVDAYFGGRLEADELASLTQRKTGICSSQTLSRTITEGGRFPAAIATTVNPRLGRGSSASSGSASVRAAPGTSTRFPVSRTGAPPARTAA